VPAAPFILNIHAGLDEFSAPLGARYPAAQLEVLDFYDPALHTEPSIRRARKAYPLHPGTKAVSTSALPVGDASADLIILALAAHEIRDDAERATFFRELARALKADGRVVVTEHLRDLPNFLAYNIGAFHFLPRSSWYRVFEQGGLELIREQKHTPFITTFVLRKHGAAS
jgi:SAM-dependent methyltransferase